jgi:hypothetical protein
MAAVGMPNLRAAASRGTPSIKTTEVSLKILTPEEQQRVKGPAPGTNPGTEGPNPDEANG